MTISQKPQRPAALPERVAAYVRVSTQEQKLHGYSLDAQRMKLTEFAHANNMQIVGWYEDEGVSGRKLIRKRPELQRMICDAEKGLFTRIIMIKLDRFFRSVAEYHECMKRISPVVWTTTEESYDLTTAQGRLLVNMKLTIAELEADQTGERIKLVNEYKVKTGQPLWGKQSLPLGFMVGIDPASGKKCLVHDPSEEQILNDLIEYFIVHQNKKKTLRFLREKYNIDMHPNSLTLLLSNPLLYGSYRDNPHYCQGYIDKATFDMIQDIQSRNIKVNTAENRVYLFSGLLRCPKCGASMSGGAITKELQSGRVHYKRYRCSKYGVRGTCSFNTAIAESTIERLMLNTVEPYFREYQLQSFDMDAAVKAPIINVNAIYEEMDRLNYAWQTGKIRTVAQYEAQYAELQTKLRKAEAARKKAPIEDFSRIEKILSGNWRSIYEALSDEYKQAFWRSIIRTIELTWTKDTKRIREIQFL